MKLFDAQAFLVGLFGPPPVVPTPGPDAQGVEAGLPLAAVRDDLDAAAACPGCGLAVAEAILVDELVTDPNKPGGRRRPGFKRRMMLLDPGGATHRCPGRN